MEERNDMIKKSIAAFIIIVLIMIAVSVAFRYNIEGEENMPFVLSKVLIISTAGSEDNQTDDTNIEGTIIQNNDVYFEIQKNSNYTKEATIKTVEISNITITNEPVKGIVKTYIPNTENSQDFKFSDDYILEGNSLTYKGANKSDTTKLEINNQGGVALIAFGNTKLGTYQLSSEGITMDGTILKLAKVSKEDIKFTVDFDLIISTEGRKYKTHITLDLPEGNIIEDGKSTTEMTDTSKYVFKRIKE